MLNDDTVPTLDTYEALMLDFLGNYNKLRKECISHRLMLQMLDEEANTLRNYLFAYMANREDD